MTAGEELAGLGRVSIRRIADDHPRPKSSSEYDDWGEFAPEAREMSIDRWLIEVTSGDTVMPVGDLSAHAVWHGPTPGSRACNIGISLSEDWRGRGIGAVAQRLLAEELHADGVIRVEASTDVINVAEQRALARAGFQLDGVLRGAQQRRDGQHDLQVWSHVASSTRSGQSEMPVGLAAAASPLDEVDLAAAYPWPLGGPWLRGMMVLTLDGAVAGADGRSGSISSPSDRRVLAEARRLSDAVLIGAGTLRAERYTPMKARDDARGERTELGLSDAPVLAIVSGSLDLPWTDPVFAQSDQRPIVLTTADEGHPGLAAARAAADVVVLPGRQAAAVEAVDALHARGLTRIVCEGGVRLLAGVAAAGLIDEVDLSLSPLLAAGGQVHVGPPQASPTRYELVQVLHDDGFLFTRYVALRPHGSRTQPE
jgi:riboflavin biosynthesis pyrimidine reductase/RimJ/RimL family protein N-acetyltransferase